MGDGKQAERGTVLHYICKNLIYSSSNRGIPIIPYCLDTRTFGGERKSIGLLTKTPDLSCLDGLCVALTGREERGEEERGERRGGEEERGTGRGEGGG